MISPGGGRTKWIRLLCDNLDIFFIIFVVVVILHIFISIWHISIHNQENKFNILLNRRKKLNIYLFQGATFLLRQFMTEYSMLDAISLGF